MFLSSLIEELCTKEENNKTGFTLTFEGQCTLNLAITVSNIHIIFPIRSLLIFFFNFNQFRKVVYYNKIIFVVKKY